MADDFTVRIVAEDKTGSSGLARGTPVRSSAGEGGYMEHYSSPDKKNPFSGQDYRALNRFQKGVKGPQVDWEDDDAGTTGLLKEVKFEEKLQKLADVFEKNEAKMAVAGEKAKEKKEKADEKALKKAVKEKARFDAKEEKQRNEELKNRGLFNKINKIFNQQFFDLMGGTGMVNFRQLRMLRFISRAGSQTEMGETPDIMKGFGFGKDTGTGAGDSAGSSGLAKGATTGGGGGGHNGLGYLRVLPHLFKYSYYYKDTN